MILMSSSTTFSDFVYTSLVLVIVLQPKRLGALNKFKAKAQSILLATDVASR